MFRFDFKAGRVPEMQNKGSGGGIFPVSGISFLFSNLPNTHLHLADTFFLE